MKKMIRFFAFAGILAGVFAYSPPAGTLLSVGNGQKLTVSFTPFDTNDFKSVTTSVLINVLPQPTQPVASIISSTLDFPAPQSPWTPIVIGCSGCSRSNVTIVLAMASLFSKSTFVSLSDRIMTTF